MMDYTSLSVSTTYWLVVSTPLKNMKVSWDYSSQYMEKKRLFQTTNQQSFLTYKIAPCIATN